MKWNKLKITRHPLGVQWDIGGLPQAPLQATASLPRDEHAYAVRPNRDGENQKAYKVMLNDADASHYGEMVFAVRVWAKDETDAGAEAIKQSSKGWYNYRKDALSVVSVTEETPCKK